MDELAHSFFGQGLGTIAALIAGETKGLALADLSGASTQVMTSEGKVVYAGLSGGSQPTGIYRSDLIYPINSP